MDLTSKQRRHLRALAHHLSPVVMVGNAGVTDGVAEAVDVALTTHELIKVRVDADGPEDRHEVADALVTRLRAAEVQVIGHVVVLYRRHPTEAKIALPDLPRGGRAEGPQAPPGLAHARRGGPGAPAAPAPRALQSSSWPALRFMSSETARRSGRFSYSTACTISTMGM